MQKSSKPNPKSQALLQEYVLFQSAMQKAEFAGTTQKIYMRAINQFAKRNAAFLLPGAVYSAVRTAS